MLPMTATPRAPPTWRATALAADPTPESPWGTDPTTELVAVGSRSPAPSPINSRPGTTLPYVVATDDAAEICQRPPATDARPTPSVNLTPMMRATSGDSGAQIQSTAAIGRMRSPA